MKLPLSLTDRSKTAEAPGQTAENQSSSETALLLAVVGLLSAVIYWLAFVRPYSLLQWGQMAQMSIAKMTDLNIRAAWSYAIAFIILFALYWTASRRILGTQDRSAWAIVIGGAVLFSAILIWLYPTDALDIFDYIIRGRMQAIYGANPFYAPPSAYQYDPLFRFTGWKGATTAYGPGWEMIAAVVARFAGDGVLANVLAFKMVNILAYFGSILLIARMLLKHAPERALFGVLLFAWNPLVLYVVAGNGHNDSLMVFFVALGFYFLSVGRFTLAALAQVAGALVKFIPALLFPLMLLAGWKRMKTWPARIAFLLITGGASLLLTLVVFYPYYHGGDFLGTKWRSNMFTTSLSTWAVILLRQKLGISPNFSDLLVSRGALILLSAWIGRELLRLWRRKDEAAAEFNWTPYARAGLSIFLFYLLVACLWFQPWYVIWGVALAALLPEDGLTRGTIFLSLMSNWKMIIFDYYIVHGGPLPPFVQREWPLTALTLAPSWAFFLAQWHVLQRLPRRLVGRLRGQPQPTTLVAVKSERE
ncbi:MAG: glycosyltransferase 87 family protein [Rudaea sp.]